MQSIQSLLEQYHIQPKRHRGQNFLIDSNVLQKIFSAIEFEKTDTVLEVGAGFGVLTGELLPRVRRVIAVELDKELAQILRTTFSSAPNLEIIQDDILALPLSRFGAHDGSYGVVANLPYNITSRFLRKFLEGLPRPRVLYLLVQKEVAQRMCTKAGDMNLLALSVQYFSHPRILFPVSRNCFYPKPRIESAYIALNVKTAGELLFPGQTARMFALARAAFSEKRKQCARTIARKLALSPTAVLQAFQQLGITPAARAQEISLDQWKALSTLLYA